MLHDRLYFLDAASGAFQRAEDIFKGTDQESIAAAKAMPGSRPMELWQGARLIQRFQAAAAVGAAE